MKRRTKATATARRQAKVDKAFAKLEKRLESIGTVADVSALSEDEQRALVVLWQDVNALLGIAVERLTFNGTPFNGPISGFSASAARAEALTALLMCTMTALQEQIDAAPAALVKSATEARKGAWKDKQVKRPVGVVFSGPDLKSPFEEVDDLWEHMSDSGRDMVRLAQKVGKPESYGPSGGFYYHLLRVLAVCGFSPPRESDDDGSKSRAEDPDSNPGGN